MRIVTEATQTAWESAYKGGDARATVRVTISRLFSYDTTYDQSILPGTHREGAGVYRSAVFGQADQPVELPNVAKVSIERGVDQDAATCTIELWNTRPLAMGEVPTDTDLKQLDLPGWFTAGRGVTADSIALWEQTPNGWKDYLTPDRVIKTYHGYGFDMGEAPESDPNLYLTGTWLIDDVEYTADGMIRLTCRDFARLLLDQICLPPTVPWAEYPLRWETFNAVANPPIISSALETSWFVPTYSTDSNRPYIGAGFTDGSMPYVRPDGSVLGHRGAHAFDASLDTYWLSVGNYASWESAFEYVQGSFSPRTISAVQVSAWGGPYTVYVSVLSPGSTWHGTSKIPYHARAIDTNADVPFVAKARIAKNGTLTIKLPKAYSAAAVRITFADLYDSGIGKYQYRAGCRRVRVLGTSSVSTSSDGGTHLEGNYGDYCLDDQSQILTRRGWLRQEELEVGDEALAQDPDTGIASWQVVESIYRRHRRRKMLRMTSRNHSSVTTHNHRWLVTDQSGRRKWRTTETLRSGQSIPTCAPVDLPNDRKYDDAFVRLVAWLYTEGWRHGEAWGLAQSERVNADHVRSIRETLTDLYGPPGLMRRSRRSAPAGEPLWSEGVKGDLATWRISKFADGGLSDALPDKVPSPEFLTALTQEQLEIFIETSVDADGWRRGKSRFFGQKDERRVDAFVMACSLAGIATSVTRQGDYHTVALLQRKSVITNAITVDEVEYDGVVWCPTLRHHNFLARRDGQVFFTGNTDIVKILCSWGGLHWPKTGAYVYNSDGSQTSIPPAVDDPIIGIGRAWGDFESTGTAGVADLDEAMWDKIPLMDGISQIRDIVGFNFWVDEAGGAIWRMPNIWSIGNYVHGLDGGPHDPTRSSNLLTIIDDRTLLNFSAKLSSRNVRDRVMVAAASGRYGAVSPGYNPTPTGFVRVGGWTDQRFASEAECQIMADLITLRQSFQYRTAPITIPGHPGVQIDDQVRVQERVTADTFVHYVRGYSSTWERATGRWTMDLDVHWLGEVPGQRWAFDPAALAVVTQQYLAALGYVTTITGDVTGPGDIGVTPDTPPGDIPPPSGDFTTSVFEDTFSGSSVDTSKWNVRTDYQSNHNGRNFAKCATVTGGALHIRSGTDNDIDPSAHPWTTAYLDTIHKSHFKYGKWEIRCRFPWGPTGKGYWPAFWLRPEDGGIGEIDIMEAWANRKSCHVSLWRDYTGTPHVEGPQFATSIPGFVGTDWHTYAVEKEPGALRFYVDDVLNWTASASNVSWFTEAFDRDVEWNIRLQLQIGGSYEGTPNSGTILSQTYDVDYVRVLAM